MRAEGDTALALYRGESGFAAIGYSNVHIEAVEQLLGQLDRLAEQVRLRSLGGEWGEWMGWCAGFWRGGAWRGSGLTAWLDAR